MDVEYSKLVYVTYSHIMKTKTEVLTEPFNTCTSAINEQGNVKNMLHILKKK